MSVMMEMTMTMTLRTCSSCRHVPQNVCRGGVACTINTRYEDAAVTDMINLAHFPKTVVLYVYENNSNQHHIGRTLQDSGNEILR